MKPSWAERGWAGRFGCRGFGGMGDGVAAGFGGNGGAKGRFSQRVATRSPWRSCMGSRAAFRMGRLGGHAIDGAMDSPRRGAWLRSRLAA